MPARIFLDSNILVYAFSETEPEKCRIARELWLLPEAWVSTQVLNEVANVLRRKFRLPFHQIGEVILEINRTLAVLTVDYDIIEKAITLAQRHPHSYFDALMLAAASHLECETLYSEDLQHQAKIQGVKIINPFISIA
ncbi:MAG: PIN domain-containing protein [Chromatiales bacterium]|nr:PIN domain-containing protein [Chromatiales bacterium]